MNLKTTRRIHVQNRHFHLSVYCRVSARNRTMNLTKHLFSVSSCVKVRTFVPVAKSIGHGGAENELTVQSMNFFDQPVSITK